MSDTMEGRIITCEKCGNDTFKVYDREHKGIVGVCVKCGHSEQIIYSFDPVEGE